MSFYSDKTATALKLLTKFGSSLTLRSTGTVADPVTGLGAASGADRTAYGLVVGVDLKVFPETRSQTGDKMLVIEGAAAPVMSDKWVDGSDIWSIIGIETVGPNNSDTVINKVLVRA